MKATERERISGSRGLSLNAWIAALGLICVFLAGTRPALTRAQEAVDSELPQIEAKPFATRVLKRSQSVRVYLMEAKDYMPRVGKIVLLKRESDNIVAFRVIKTYPEKHQYAGRKVKDYGTPRVLAIGDPFLALEKLRDLGPYQPTAEESRLDDADLRELEDGPPRTTMDGLPPVSPYDEDLDAGTSPPPAGAIDDERAEPLEPDDDDRLDNLIADEVIPLDPDRQWLSAEFGYLRNFDPRGGSRTNTGGGFRYGFTVGKLIFLSSTKAQDSLVLEGGAFLYKLLIPSSSSAYTVMPLIGTVRYNIVFSEDFTLFFYTGLNSNVVLSASQGTQAEVNLLSSTLPAGGAGAIFRVGPKWHLRIDAGLDMIGSGLMLRF